MIISQKEYSDRIFKDLNVSSKSFEKIEFDDCKFKAVNFQQTGFKNCRFISCLFDNCNLSSADFTNTRFIKTKFMSCKLSGVDWTKTAKIEDILYKNCILNYSNFRFLNLKGIKIIQSVAKEADFINSDLSKADLSGTDFSKAVFFKTNLTNTNLTSSKNYWIDPRVNNLKNAVFSLPEAFSLLTAQDIKVQEY